MIMDNLTGRWMYWFMILLGLRGGWCCFISVVGWQVCILSFPSEKE